MRITRSNRCVGLIATIEYKDIEIAQRIERNKEQWKVELTGALDPIRPNWIKALACGSKSFPRGRQLACGAGKLIIMVPYVTMESQSF